MKIEGVSESLHERDGAALDLIDAVVARQAAVKREESPDKDLNTAVTIFES